MNILIAYESLSGHTKILAEYIAREITEKYHPQVDIKNVLIEKVEKDYDFYIIGSWTCGLGETPEDIKAFCKTLPRESLIASFGTGETQWGTEFFCGASIRIANYFKSPFEVLKIEQMLVNQHQKQEVDLWLNKIFQYI